MTPGANAALDGRIEALLRHVSETIVLPRFRNLAGHEIAEKAQDDLVTIADREAEEALYEGLAQIEPGLAVVGEEAAHADPCVLDRLKGDCWIVDPIDGTHNFAHGQPPFGLLLAQAAGGMAHSGWIYDCLSGRFCVAHAGKGASVNGQAIRATPTGESPPVAAISKLFLSDEQRIWFERRVEPHYRLVEIPRCAAEQYPRLALGRNDVSTFQRTLPWDHAAGVLWLNEAGGKAARIDDSAYRVDEGDREGLVGAASPQLWDDLVALLADAV